MSASLVGSEMCIRDSDHHDHHDHHDHRDHHDPIVDGGWSAGFGGSAAPGVYVLGAVWEGALM
eukprot:14512750-Alexandrium_andersonii.AAC.1